MLRAGLATYGGGLLRLQGDPLAPREPAAAPAGSRSRPTRGSPTSSFAFSPAVRARLRSNTTPRRPEPAVSVDNREPLLDQPGRERGGRQRAGATGGEAA